MLKKALRWTGPAALAAAALVVAPSPAEAAETMKGSAVYRSFIEGVGGLGAISKIHSFHASGSYVVGPLEGTIDLYYAEPDHLIFKVDLPGYGTILSGHSDGQGWSSQPGQPLSPADADSLKKMQKWIVRGFSVLPGSKKIRPADRAEKVTFEGRPAWKVNMTIPSVGAEYVEYYDTKTGLLAGRTEKVSTPQGDLEMQGWFAEYREFGGVLIPTKCSHKAGPQEWSAVYETIEVNNVDMSVFEPPVDLAGARGPARKGGGGH